MASDLNQVTLEGNLTRDPVLKNTNSGTSVCNFSIASNRYFKKGDGFDKETSFFDVQCWSQLAQDVCNNCFKGTAVKITGRLKQERWLKNGVNQSRVSIVADNVLQINRIKNYNNHIGELKGTQENDCPF